MRGELRDARDVPQRCKNSFLSAHLPDNVSKYQSMYSEHDTSKVEKFFYQSLSLAVAVH